MDRCDFSSIMTYLKNQISESNQMSQPEFLYEIFEDFLDSPENKEFTLDNGLVCRWMTGQAKISPKISSFYAKPSNQEKLAKNIQQNILPLMADYSRTLQDIYTLFIQDSSISEAKKAELAPLYKPADLRLLFLAKLISFGMERPFIKRDTKNQKLIAGGSLSPMVLDYIMDSEVPRPCRHFVGREDETTELHSLLEDNSKAFLYGIAGIEKSEQNPMQSTIKSITQTSCILNMPEIYINLLRIWILLMIYRKIPKKNVSENTTVSFVL